MNKTLFSFLAALFCTFSVVQAEPLHLTIIEKVFTTTTHYDIDSPRGYYGHVQKNHLSIYTNYHYFDAQGRLCASAYLRLLSLGQAFTWAGVLDVYDGNNEWMGSIKGSYMTLCPAEFKFYDHNDNLVAMAFMDSDRTGFSVVDPNNYGVRIATFKRVFIPKAPDYWTVTIENMDTIDPRYLAVFGAFMLDNQSEFRPDL